ncbi:MAG: hypothetical protein D6808_02215 [Candidatus Dadabacteria bacterium]|nr:MAG: hypothetical protein D6808_02215 [Candidatus Dadabacteria bacterium]
MVCGDDSPLNKSDPAYWDELFRRLPEGAVAGFEDNPVAARWMLAHDRCIRVFALIEPDSTEALSLKREFGERIKCTRSWGELLSPMEGQNND